MRGLALRAKARLERNEYALALEDVDRSLRIEPDSLESLGMRGVLLQRLGRNDDARKAYEQLEKQASATQNQAAAGACLALVSLSPRDGDPVLAQVRSCAERYPLNAPEAEAAVTLLDQAKRGTEATALLREWVAKQEDNLRLRSVLVARLLRLGEREEAAAAIEPLAKGASTTAEWMLVGGLKREAGRTEEALAAYRKAADLDPAFLTARHIACDLLVELGRLAEAETAAAEMPDPTLRDFVLGRVALARGDATRALQLLNGALLQWPSNEGGRLLAARAALQLGRLNEGMDHLREAARASGGKGEPVLLLAQLAYARGDYLQTNQLLETYMQRRTPDPTKIIERTPDKESEPELPAKIAPEAHVLLAKLAVAVGQYDSARKALEPLRAERPTLFAVETARVMRAEKGPAAALAALEAQKLDWADPKQELALRERVDLAVAARKSAPLSAFLDRLADQNESAVHVHVARALLCLLTHDLDGAAAAAERAAALAPEDARVLSVQGMLARVQGDLERSRPLLERAVAAAPGEASYQYELVRTLLLDGRKEESETRLRELVILQPDFAPAANDLAWLLAEQGKDLMLAEDLALRAVRRLPVPEVRDTLGYVQLRRGQFDAAVQTLETVRKDRPDYATGRYHLALALAGRGKSVEAQEELRAALSGPPFPEADAARVELARLEQGEVR
jgi:tetratricopeptide (TPR) repeat protein